MTTTDDLEMSAGRITLRDLRYGDEQAVHRIVGDPRVTQWLSFDQRDSEQAREMLSGVVGRQQETPRSEYYLAIDLSDEMIGFARLGLGGVRAAKLGYAIAADQWGNGFATEAVHIIVEFGFTELGLHRITAAIGPDNTSSIRIAEKTGFSYEGRLRDHVHTNGSWRDSLLYARIGGARADGDTS